MPSVSIGKRFLSEVRSQYEDWHAGYAREAFQNCADAPRVKNVSFRTEEVGGNTIVEFENDGAPMTREIMEGKLLTLGESGKEHHGTVGGFGRAKELLYFCHEEFEIWSGSIYVNGSGCEYEINLDSEPLKGTKSRVVIEGYHAEELNRAFRKCISYSMFKGSVTLNGEVIEDRTNRGKKRDWGGAGEWCRVYTNRKHENLLLVRVGGIFMYSKRIWDYKGCVVVELLTSRETLTSNRDSLKWEYREAIDSFIEDISTNKRKAFRPKAPKFHRFEGTKLSADLTKEAFTLDTDAMEKNSPEAWRVMSEEEDHEMAEKLNSGDHFLASDGGSNGGGGGIVMGPETRKAAVASEERKIERLERSTKFYGGKVEVEHEFHLRNELCDSIKVPVHYNPGSGSFSTYSKWLVGVWGKLLIELHALFEHEAKFSIGFIFDEGDENGEVEALHESSHDRGTVYYIAPCKINRTRNAVSDDVRKLVPRWKRGDKYDLLAIAAHEFVHGLGYDRHNESYANKLTDVLGRVLKEKSRFSHCFKNN